MIRAANTTSRAPTWAFALILCVVALIVAGCDSGFSRRSSAPGFSPSVGPTQLSETPGKPAADRNQPPPAQPSTSTMSETARVHISPALKRITEELDASIEKCPRSRDLPRTVSLRNVRNLSHATSSEFDAMLGRVAELLSTTAEITGSELRFVADENEPAQFELLGAAYLVTLEGFDSWELYLSISRKSAPHDLWRSAGPVRVLRFEQPMAAQVFYAGSSGR